LQNALTRTGNVASASSGAAAFSTIDTEIDSGRPVCARIGWSGGGGHFVAIVGYNEALLASTNYFAIADPWYGSSDVAENTFRTSYQGSGTWTDTFYTNA
jgi:Peptidase_C39 like family